MTETISDSQAIRRIYGNVARHFRRGRAPWEFTQDHENQIETARDETATHPGRDEIDRQGRICRTIDQAKTFRLIDFQGNVLYSSDDWGDLLGPWARAEAGEPLWRIRGYPSGPDEWAEAVADLPYLTGGSNPWDSLPHGDTLGPDRE